MVDGLERVGMVRRLDSGVLPRDKRVREQGVDRGC